MDDTDVFAVFSGTDVAVQQPVDVPQSFNDQGFIDNAPSPDSPNYWVSQSAIERGGSPSGFVESASDQQAAANYAKNLGNGFMDAAAKLLTSLRGNTGQDRNAATGRARPQRTVADLLGLSGASGTVQAQAPGMQGMWILMVMGAAFLALVFLARR